jgi:hypothetical protein
MLSQMPFQHGVVRFLVSIQRVEYAPAEAVAAVGRQH